MKGIDVENILERLLAVKGNKPGKTVDLKEFEHLVLK